MKLIFSTDRVRFATITNPDGQVLYKITTSGSPFNFIKSRTTTIWKTIPNSSSPIYHEHLGDGAPGQLISNDSYTEGDGVREGEGLSEVDMQDHFTRVAEIEWHTLSSSRIRWHGVINGLGVGEVQTSEFIPPKGLLRVQRVFTGVDERPYRWELGAWVCSLYLDDQPSKLPIAKYHRSSLGLLPGTKAHQGYLEVHPRPVLSGDLTGSHPGSSDDIDINSYTDYELESHLDDADRTRLDQGMLDLIVVTFIYCEKLRRDQEQANEKDFRWTW
ncbi:hypothetical protein SERLA73DRAFT_76544 [Serpula lacrymans var. lacrymans S7.3]|uniref:DUF6593 domain-containing protein n=2 Tax=Serpula lacrymans var. lacrymans TaxID=341189 RepID=F8Q7A2_SERL3|nr:uncharacterized protein SERLADRAFT_441357 [Serpula lacrymans var. lacrymans S7.9]EGN95440.1 hypothetical protein SERLA73DRAFT_76544 [Serpula lacrymans var. lacrymans S7.3]EGO20971.1 hypothetical protein SERLADRAFT_441357 [Serpula lacrymans var. lacrymans S7.9]